MNDLIQFVDALALGAIFYIFVMLVLGKYAPPLPRWLVWRREVERALREAGEREEE